MSITLDVLRPTFHPSEEDLEDSSQVESEDITARDANVKAVFTSVQTHWDLIANIFKKRVRVSANQNPVFLRVSQSEHSISGEGAAGETQRLQEPRGQAKLREVRPDSHEGGALE